MRHICSETEKIYSIHPTEEIREYCAFLLAFNKYTVDRMADLKSALDPTWNRDTVRFYQPDHDYSEDLKPLPPDPPPFKESMEICYSQGSRLSNEYAHLYFFCKQNGLEMLYEQVKICYDLAMSIDKHIENQEKLLPHLKDFTNKEILEFQYKNHRTEYWTKSMIKVKEKRAKTDYSTEEHRNLI